MNFPGVLPLLNFTVCDGMPPCLHTIVTSFTNVEIVFFIKMFFFVQVDGTTDEVVGASIEVVKTSMDSTETSSFL